MSAIYAAGADLVSQMAGAFFAAPWPLQLALVAFLTINTFLVVYLGLFVVAPTPRAPLSSEQTYIHIEPSGSVTSAQPLPCWQDTWRATKRAAARPRDPVDAEPADVFMSLVIPAYNEEARLETMLREAVEYLEATYPLTTTTSSSKSSAAPKPPKSKSKSSTKTGGAGSSALPSGWEILLVSDGSTDRTVDVALGYARTLPPAAAAAIRIIRLAENRGKGGAVTHGMRHVRGAYAVFADADGATRFSDLGACVAACRAIEDGRGRGVAVGSRAHLVGSDAVVRRSLLRNFLMHSFHLLIRMMTPPATGRIRDTQCGFKLFSRASLPFVVPYMHCEGWIFDVEMLMLAESADIPVAEVPVGWKEVAGSKLDVLWDSLGMAWGLAVLRLAWGLGVYSRW